MIKFKKGYVAVYGNTIPIKIGQFLVGNTQKVRACAWPPFIFFKEPIFETPWVVNHERIHFLQTFELLFIGAFVLWITEYVYAKFFLHLSDVETYHYSELEQEAYLNHHDLDYLKKRKFFSVLKYIRNKKKFSIDKDGLVILKTN